MGWPFQTTDLGFPSGHTIVAFAGAAAIARLFPRAGPLAYLLAAGCGLTRILSHAHFAGDVVGGAIAGWAIVAALWRIVDRRPPAKQGSHA